MTCANSDDVSTGKNSSRGSWGKRKILTPRAENGGLYLPRPRAGSHDAVLAGALGLVERAVGGRDQALADGCLREGGDAEADRHVDARSIGREDRALLERAACALGQAGGPVEVGPRQDDRELLPAPTSGNVDLPHAFPQRLGELDEHAVADGMAEAVVDRLEAVQVGEHERDRTAEALGAHQLAGERLLAVTAVGEPGEHVDERLARHDPVQTRVLERDRRVGDERSCGAPLLEREAAAGGRERAEALAAGRERQLESLATVRERPRLDDLAAEPDDDAAGRAGRLDHRLDDHAQELIDVVGCCERVAETDGRVTHTRPLSVELLEPRLELVGHLVEGRAEAGELVAAVNLDAP